MVVDHTGKGGVEENYKVVGWYSAFDMVRHIYVSVFTNL